MYFKLSYFDEENLLVEVVSSDLQKLCFYIVENKIDKEVKLFTIRKYEGKYKI